MPAPRPTSWPTVFPPHGGYDEVGAIADYMNEPILEHHDRVNAQRVAEGKRPYSVFEWEVHYYPLFPRTGWLDRTDVPLADRQVIGRIGLRGFGLHEFPGDPDSPIRRRQNEMQALANGSPYVPPVAPPVVEPPPVVDPPAPPVEPPPLPPGTPPPGTPPPYTPPPTTGQDLMLGNGRFRATCRQFSGGEGGGSPATAIRISDIAGYFVFFSADNVEIVVKYADLSSIGMPRRFFISAMTDVAFELAITDLPARETLRFKNPAGHLLGEILDFPA